MPGWEAEAVSLVTAVQVPRRSASLLEPLIRGQRYLQLAGAAERVRRPGHHRPAIPAPACRAVAAAPGG